jgi:hypothetical protein
LVLGYSMKHLWVGTTHPFLAGEINRIFKPLRLRAHPPL